MVHEATMELRTGHKRGLEDAEENHYSKKARREEAPPTWVDEKLGWRQGTRDLAKLSKIMDHEYDDGSEALEALLLVKVAERRDSPCEMLALPGDHFIDTVLILLWEESGADRCEFNNRFKTKYDTHTCQTLWKQRNDCVSRTGSWR